MVCSGAVQVAAPIAAAAAALVVVVVMVENGDIEALAASYKD